MFIPRYWSEASHREQVSGSRQSTIRRFGWSSTSQADADVHARQRVEEAAAVLRTRGPDALDEFTRRERATAYGGSQGLPIREEIVLERPDADVVVTRNGYGALCLNTTRAMFVDVDRPTSHFTSAGCVGAVVGSVVGALVGWLFLDLKPLLAAAIGLAAVGLVSAAGQALRERRDPRMRDTVQWAVARTRAWCSSRPAWRVAIYETPGGARLLALHAAFDAGEPTNFHFMDFVTADPLYQRMCRLQKCFRARVSPKPWRVGMKEHFKTGGTWPVRDSAKLARRAAWVQQYEQASRDSASCRFIEAIGDGTTDPRIEPIARLHDDMCHARTDRALA